MDDDRSGARWSCEDGRARELQVEATVAQFNLRASGLAENKFHFDLNMGRKGLILNILTA
jgi:hypothetical protein